MRKITLVTVCTILCTLVFHITAHSYYQDNSAFFEDFSTGWDSKWEHSSNPKYQGKFSVVTPEGWSGAKALQIPEASKFYGISTKTAQPIDPSEGLVVQYEVKFSQGITCGGAYLKLLTDSTDFSPSSLSNDSPYTIMFGPDACGATSKVHLIFRYKNPINGTISEKHLMGAPSVPTDESTHIYTLILSADNTYEVLVDDEVKASGSLLTSFEPAFIPPKEILDPSDHKPSDWVDAAKIPDPAASKPDDWEDEPQVEDMKASKPRGWLDDEEQFIPDPAAQKPVDWDEEEDGEWEPATKLNPKCKVGCGEWKRPMTLNPKYKGPWTAPLIDNPAYKGPWVQKKLPNPDYYEDATPLKGVGKIGAVAVEVWTVDSGYTFGNIMLTSDKSIAKEFRNRVWKAKFDAEEKVAADKIKAATDADRKTLADVIEDMFSLPTLEPVKPYVQPLLDLMHQYVWLSYAVFVLPIFLVGGLIFLCTTKPKKDSGVGTKKKEDISEEDDEEEEEDKKAEDKAAPSAAVKAPSAAVKAPVSTKHSEIEEEDEDEDAGPVRRRKGKA